MPVTNGGAVSLVFVPALVDGGQAPADVVCAVDGRRLLVAISSAAVGAATAVAAELVVIGYQGAGTYTATGSVEFSSASTGAISFPLVAEATILESLGGTISVTIDEVALTLGWTCGP